MNYMWLIICCLQEPFNISVIYWLHIIEAWWWSKRVNMQIDIIPEFGIIILNNTNPPPSEEKGEKPIQCVAAK